MKRFLLIGLLCSMFAIAGCDQGKARPSSADVVQQQATAQSMAEAQRQIGMPAIKNFQERKLAKMIFEL